MSERYSKSILNEMDKAKRLHNQLKQSVEKIETYFDKKGYLEDGDDRGIYIDGKYIGDMSYFEYGEMDSRKFLEELSR